MTLPSPLQVFVDKGGFKLLAVARLGPGSLSLVCYLVNCMAAGVDEVVSSHGELAVLLGIPERAARAALEELESCRILAVTHPSPPSAPARLGLSGGKTVALRLNLETSTWQNLRKETQGGKRKRTPLGDAKNVHPLHPQRPHDESAAGHDTPSGAPPGTVPSTQGTPGTGSSSGRLRDVTHEVSKEAGSEAVRGAAGEEVGLSPGDALLFPSGGGVGSSADEPEGELAETAVRRVLEAFAASKEAPLDEEKERAYAALLCENHPVEQIVLLIEAFGREIPSLGLLAGAWMHFSERFHHLEKEEISLLAFRKKVETLERRLRALALSELKRAQSLKVILSADEELLLRIFTRHVHPRRQLYWALQTKERYPHLQDFFNATAHMAQKPQKPQKP